MKFPGWTKKKLPFVDGMGGSPTVYKSVWHYKGLACPSGPTFLVVHVCIEFVGGGKLHTTFEIGKGGTLDRIRSKEIKRLVFEPNRPCKTKVIKP
jgi:hypothetical protein